MSNSPQQFKVSVIVPVYNVAPFIERCASSLFTQTLPGIEFIFVDDCSPDDSIQRVKQLLAHTQLPKSSCVQVLRTPSNAGLAGVRRMGILNAHGDYIIHCDGDDWVDPDLYERLYAKAIAEDADVVMCPEQVHWPSHTDVGSLRPMPATSREVMRQWYKNTIGLFCHNKLIRRSLYADHDILPWPGLNMWEDNGLMARLFYYGGKLSTIDGSYYHYNRLNPTAMTAGYGEKQVNQMIAIAEHLTQFFRSQPDAADFEKTVLAFQFLARINLITNTWSGLKRFRTTFPGSEAIISELDPKAFSRKGLIRFKMVKHRLAWLFILLFKIYNAIKRL